MKARTIQMLMGAMLVLFPLFAGAVTHDIYVDAAAAPPGDGSQESPYPRIWDALRPGILYQPGDLVYVHVASGVYREKVSKAGWVDDEVDLIIEGDPENRPVISGSDLFGDWTQSTGLIYSTPWNWDLFAGVPDFTEENDNTYYWLYGEDEENTYRAEYLTRWESVWVDGERMQQALNVNEAAQGTFLVDQGDDLLYLWTVNGTPPSQHTVAATVREQCANFNYMNNVTLRNLEFRHARVGVYSTFTTSLTLDNCLVHDNVNDGVAVSRMGGFNVVNTEVYDNGFCGIQPSFSCDISMDEVFVHDNNWRGARVHAGNWRVAGMKLYAVSGVELRDVVVSNNLAAGVWFDRYCDTVLMANCLMNNNYGSGLFWEISPGPMTLNHCEVANNGRGLDLDPELATTYSGLLINSGSDIQANLCGFYYNQPYNVEVANSGRTAQLWKEGQSGNSDPIEVEDLGMGYCTFEHNEPLDESIYVPDWLDPETFWAEQIVVSPLACAEQVIPAQYRTPREINPRIVMYPNPTNAATTVRYILPDPAEVTVRVFDMLGRTVQLISNRMGAGEHLTLIDGSHMSSGTYFVAIEADGRGLGTSKVIFVK